MESKKTFKNYFDKIFCISFVEAQNRRDYINKQLSELDLLDGIEYSYGMPFNKIRPMAKHFNEMAQESHIHSLSVNGIGCSFNHYSAVKAAYESGANSVLIFEDDSLFLKNRETIISYLDNIPSDWDYLYFTPTFVVYYDMHDMDLFRTSKDMFINLKNLNHGKFHWTIDYNTTNCWMSSCAYAMNRNAMKLYISVFENNHRIINSDFVEYFFHNLIASPLTSYTTNIRLVAQPSEMNTLKFDEEEQKYIIKNNGGMVSNCTNVTSENFFDPDPSIKSFIS